MGVLQLLITIDRGKSARFGILLSDIQHVIQTAIGGKEVSQLFDDVKRFDIQVRVQERFRKSKQDIETLVIRAPKGEMLPLVQLADIKEGVGPRQITRENNQRFISIHYNVEWCDIGPFVEEGQQIISEKVTLLAGYTAVLGGQFEL